MRRYISLSLNARAGRIVVVSRSGEDYRAFRDRLRRYGVVVDEVFSSLCG